MRSAAHLFIVLAAVGAWFFAAAAPAHSTTFVLMDEDDLAAQSVAAVIGRVRRVEAVGEADGAVRTYVHLDAEQILFGAVPVGSLVLREPGGRIRERSEKIFGAPEYATGERVLAFLSQNADGTLRTTAMAMGRYRLEADAAGAQIATRTLGEGAAVFDPVQGRLDVRPAPRRRRLGRLVARLTGAAGAAPVRPLVTNPAAVRQTARARAPFTFLAAPSRWFEPDDDVPVEFLVDATGDLGVGEIESRAAVADALAAWSDVSTSSLLLADGGSIAPTDFAGCTGPNRIVFNDPGGEINPPVDCRGVLAIGGFCFDEQQRRTVNGVDFNRITIGKVTLNDGFSDCRFWNPCNVAEVVTHELGHAIGFGHSEDEQATMAAVAQFDGRCAGLDLDDIYAVSSVYPFAGTPPTATATPTPEATATASPSATPTVPPTETRTRTFPPTRTRAATATRTRVATATPHDTATVGPQTPTTNDKGGISGAVRLYGTERVVPGVSVAVLGASATAVESGADGRYAVRNLGAGVRAVEPAKQGDVGNGISALDAALVLEVALGQRVLSDALTLACDVTGNGSLSELDAARILERTVGAPERFSVAEACESDWAFLPDPAAAENQEIVPPQIGPGTCRRGAISYAPLSGELSGQDFRAILFGDCTGNWQPGAVQELAPADTEVATQALRRLRGGRLRLPVTVRAPRQFRALEIELRFDPAQMELRAVLPLQQTGSLVRFSSDVPGRVLIALASGLPLPGDGGVELVVEFQSLGPSQTETTVRLFSATVDERLVGHD